MLNVSVLNVGIGLATFESVIEEFMNSNFNINIKILKVLSDIRTEVIFVGELDLLCLSKALLQGFFLVLL